MIAEGVPDGEQRDVTGPDAHVAGEFGLGAAIGLQIDVAEVEQVVADDVPDGEDLWRRRRDGHVARTGSVLGHVAACRTEMSCSSAGAPAPKKISSPWPRNSSTCSPPR